MVYRIALWSSLDLSNCFRRLDFPEDHENSLKRRTMQLINLMIYLDNYLVSDGSLYCRVMPIVKQPISSRLLELLDHVPLAHYQLDSKGENTVSISYPTV